MRADRVRAVDLVAGGALAEHALALAASAAATSAATSTSSAASAGAPSPSGASIEKATTSSEVRSKIEPASVEISRKTSRLPQNAPTYFVISIVSMAQTFISGDAP